MRNQPITVMSSDAAVERREVRSRMRTLMRSARLAAHGPHTNLWTALSGIY